MSIVSDASKIAENVVEAGVNAPPIDQSFAIYEIALMLFVILIVVLIGWFYKTIIRNIKEVGEQASRSVKDINDRVHSRIDKHNTNYNAAFKEVREECALKEKRLTQMETNLENVEEKVETSEKDMAAHKAEANIRFAYLEETNKKLFEKFEVFGKKFEELGGKIDRIGEWIRIREKKD